MKLRSIAFAVLFALLSTFMLAPSATSAATKDKNFLKNLPVSGTVAEGGTFDGKLTLTGVGYNEVTGFTVDGVLKGKVRDASGKVVENVNQRFSGAAATLNETSSSAFTAQATCDILFLDLGPLSLDLLGLTIDLSEIVLDINAVSGAGNLLGNLLCAVAGLLDPAGFLTDLLAGLEALTELITRINDLLG
jgi:hypothetical protein